MLAASSFGPAQYVYNKIEFHLNSSRLLDQYLITIFVFGSTA